jgi:predicted dienelactone hydrolase
VTTALFVNPQQWDIVNAQADQTVPLYDRPLTVEIWYPGQAGAAVRQPDEYKVYFKDGKTYLRLYGKALRDAKPQRASGPYPLVVMSHGYPGSRYLFSAIAEHLVSKGYVAVSIDHTDSTYSDQAALASSLRHRSMDVTFVIDEMIKINRDAGSPLKGLIDENRIGLMGESVGADGVINKLGGGYGNRATQYPGLPPGSLQPLLNSNPEFATRRDSRIQAAVVFEPWGWSRGFWDIQAMHRIRTPILYIAGGVNEISGNAADIRHLYEGSIHADRYLLSFAPSDRRACAQIPMSRRTSNPAPCSDIAHPIALGVDPDQDNMRTNNIARHFITAFFGKHLKMDDSKAAYLDVKEYGRHGSRSANAEGIPDARHSTWKGPSSRMGAVLRLEHLRAAAE